ncbi:1-(5-phosphoribosyl)-5-[(5-phosphoribosylamino)methylideneamino]imidazole-4-carboxamide isomerase [Alphaproteobacteria bacterium]|nr:1-(5-phosphoribosyl)-5-[(5-phosphoribosylamino)methylideneamino]imidazole-4-carboxamide isomerase [Alphaproteobacteria bacterium]
MKFIPAIDLKDNKCVRLKKGREENLTIFNDDPINQAKFFEKNGCERIHIVDLDGAFGRADVNKQTILNIRKNTKVEIELGGGIRESQDLDFWANKGIDFLIVGSLAVKNNTLIKEISKKFKNKIYVALDVLQKDIMIKGWVESSKVSINQVLNDYEYSDIKGFILTDIERDGMLEGLNINLIKENILKTNKNIIVGGGLSNYDDLINLKKISSSNLEGVIAGKSFYSGNIEVIKALKILKKNA